MASDSVCSSETTAMASDADDDHVRCHISYIRLQNFMSYRDADILLGKMNLIVGPNGSGKSSISVALGIAFGGRLDAVKRQGRLEELVRSSDKGAKEATITVRIAREQDADFSEEDSIVVRIPKEAGKKPCYFLNDSPISAQDLAAFASELGIKPNNLMQFLAQDAVRDFPKLSPQELLRQALEAIGSQETLSQHDAIVEQSAANDKMSAELRKKKEKCNDLHSAFEEYRPQWEKLERLEALREDAKMLREQKKYLAVFELKRKARAKKSKREQLQVTLTETEARLSEIENNLLGSVESDIKKLTGSIVTLRREKGVAEHYLRTSNEGLIQAEIAELTPCVVGLGAKSSAMGQLVECELELAHLPSLADLSQEKKKVEKRIAELRQTRMTCELDAATATAEIASFKLRLNERLHRQGRLKSADAHKLTLLREANEDVYKAVMWLRENASQFSGVHEPIVLSLILEDEARTGPMLEEIVGSQDLEAFICENLADASRLLHALRKEAGLRRISVVHSDVSDQRPQFKACQLKHFRGYLVNMMSGAEAVKRFLCRRHFLDKIPVFADAAAGGLKSIEAAGFSKFFVGTCLYGTKNGSYFSGKSFRCTQMDDALSGSRYFDMWNESASVKNDLALLNKEIERLGSDIDKSHALIARRREAGEAAAALLAKEQDALRVVSERLRSVSDLAAKCDLLRSEVGSKVAESGEGGDPDEMAARLEDLKKKLNEETALCETKREEVDAATHKIEFLTAQLDRLEIHRNELLSEKEEAERKLSSCERCLEEAKSAFEKITLQLRDEINKLEWEDKSCLQVPSHLVDLVNPNSSQALDVKAQLASLESEVARLEEATRHFASKKITRLANKKLSLENEVLHLEGKVATSRRLLRETSRQFSDDLGEFTMAVSSKFSSLMNELGYVGSVGLLEGIGDLAEPGLEIMVRFRASGSMQRLSATWQSGGEKSVATAAFIWTLQEMGNAPVLTFDEINQGMDRDNERSVWASLMASETVKRKQCLYLQPKLPREIETPEDVKFHFCFNGSVRRKRYD